MNRSHNHHRLHVSNNLRLNERQQQRVERREQRMLLSHQRRQDRLDRYRRAFPRWLPLSWATETMLVQMVVGWFKSNYAKLKQAISLPEIAPADQNRLQFAVETLEEKVMLSGVSLGTLTPFTGGDAGEGLDLSGNIVHAYNLGGTAQTIQGVTFEAATNPGAPPAGITTAGGTQGFNYFVANGGNNAADYGVSANDDALETMVTSVWYDPNWTFDTDIVAGNQYQLQLIFQEGFFTFQGGMQRNFDVSVETSSPSNLTLAVDDLALGMETNGANQVGADFGLVYTYTFTATDNSFSVALDDSLAGSDGNTVLSAVTLEELGAVDDDYTTTDPTDEETALNILAASGVLANDTPSDAPIVAFDTTSANDATVAVAVDGSFTYDPTGSAAIQALAAGNMLTDTFDYTIELYDQVVNVDVNDPAGPSPTYAGKGAVEDSGTVWNGATFGTGSHLDLTASNGAATDVDIYASGASGFFYDGSANALHADRLYTTPPNGSANWELRDLEIGETYDLFFYGNINATYSVSGGIAEGSVSASITSEALMTDATPDHADWIEGTHYARLRITPTSDVVGIYAPPTSANQSAWSGLQIARVATDTATVSIKVNGVNDAASIGGMLSGAMNEDDAGASGAASVSDVDDGEDVFVAQTGTVGTYGTFDIDAAGNWTYTRTADLNSMNAGDMLSDSFAVASSDGTANDNVVIDITGTNDDASIGGTLSGAMNEDDAGASGAASASDVDDGEDVFVAQAGTVGTYGDFSIDAAGNWTYTRTANLDFLSDGEEVTDSFIVTSADGTASETVTITITGETDENSVYVVGDTIVVNGSNFVGEGGEGGEGDKIDIKLGGEGAYYEIKIDNATGDTTGLGDGDATIGSHGSFNFIVPITDPSKIIVYGLDGNDKIKVHSNVTASAFLFGGNGNDKLRGGSGDDVLVGGDDDDKLDGKDGRDILIGGDGADKIRGQKDEDILIGSGTTLDNDLEALCGILGKWTGSGTFNERVADVLVDLNGNVIADDDVDELKGGSGADWLIGGDEDKIKLDGEDVFGVEDADWFDLDEPIIAP